MVRSSAACQGERLSSAIARTCEVLTVLRMPRQLRSMRLFVIVRSRRLRYATDNTQNFHSGCPLQAYRLRAQGSKYRGKGGAALLRSSRNYEKRATSALRKRYPPTRVRTTHVSCKEAHPIQLMDCFEKPSVCFGQTHHAEPQVPRPNTPLRDLFYYARFTPGRVSHRLSYISDEAELTVVVT